jgi:hypothetical protein
MQPRISAGVASTAQEPELARSPTSRGAVHPIIGGKPNWVLRGRTKTKRAPGYAGALSCSRPKTATYSVGGLILGRQRSAASGLRGRIRGRDLRRARGRRGTAAVFTKARRGCGRPRSSAPPAPRSAPAGTLGGCARRGHPGRSRGPRGRVLTKWLNGGQKSFCFRPLRVPGAPGARAAALGIGWRRGHRRLGGRLGLAAALRAGGGSVGGGSVPVPGLGRRGSGGGGPGRGPAFGGPWGGSGPRLRDSGGGFGGGICGAREDGGALQLFLRRPGGCGRPRSSAPPAPRSGSGRPVAWSAPRARGGCATGRGGY